MASSQAGSLSIGLIGVGLVGGALLRQITESPFKDQISIVALATSKKMLLSSSSLGPEDGKALQQGSASSAVTTNLSLLADHLRQIVKGQNAGRAVIVDCTATDALGVLYPQWMGQEISIVTPNKKAFSGDLTLFKAIRSLRSKAYCYHEATVGAGLPVLSTLEDMVETGDEITQIEGILSGTLSYLFNSFSPSAAPADSTPPKFSAVVKEAKNLGYTEPDPRDDLNGLDMARKVVILGRLSGMDISLDSLPVENIVPEPLRKLATAEEFLSKLGEYDEHFSKMNAEAAANGQVLRYVGVINPKGKSSVELKRYPKSHPFANLKGSDNIIAMTTKRYPNPVVIQGAGAGADVTAAGVFGDLLKIYRTKL